MDTDRARAIWENEIDRLELEVIRAERLLRGLVATPAEPWTSPSGIGPLPSDLRARAVELLERQEVARDALGMALRQAQQHLAYAERVADVRGRGIAEPVYLDLEA